MKTHHRRQTQISAVALAGCLFLVSLSSANGQPAASGTQAAVESALRDLDARWSGAATAKDLEKTLSYYSEDALVLPPNAPSATTKEAIRIIWKEILETPGMAISWKTAEVKAAQSGDLAYSSGTYELTMNDPSGKSVNDHGKYLEVWKKQADGKWKCVADIWNSDLSASAPPEKK